MSEPSPQVVVVGSYVHDMKWRTDRFPVDGEAVLGDFYDDLSQHNRADEAIIFIFSEFGRRRKGS